MPADGAGMTVSAAGAALDMLVQDLVEVVEGRDPDAARPLDALLFDRLVLGRDPRPESLEAYRERTSGRTRREFLLEALPSTEAQNAYPHVPCVFRELMWEREDGLRMFFNLRDLGVGLQICQGTFDPEVEAVLTRLAGPGVRCLDIGANLGFYTVVMGRLGARVDAFEAFPYNHRLLSRNVAENALGELVRTHEVACASAPGIGEVLIEEQSINLGSTFVPAPGTATPPGHVAQRVELARVDDLIPSDETVDLVKIDVEGAELDVFRGMPRILERDRPIIVMELNSRSLRENRGVEAAELMDHLRAHGYRAAEAASLLAGDPVWVGDLPAGIEMFAYIVCWDERHHGAWSV